jgi:hypothetical protein
MCELNKLSKTQVDNLRNAMPKSYFFDFGGDELIGVTPNKNWGTWNSTEYNPAIVTYTEMMQLLKGKDMNKQTADKYFEYLHLEQELRRAQIDAGGAGKHSILLTRSGSLRNEPSSCYHEKISFKTRESRDAFRNTHTDEQLTLLIRGV